MLDPETRGTLKYLLNKNCRTWPLRVKPFCKQRCGECAVIDALIIKIEPEISLTLAQKWTQFSEEAQRGGGIWKNTLSL